MNVLIACEESQRVCSEFRALGHNAYSCDIIEYSGGRPDWHIQCDVRDIINGKCGIKTCDGRGHIIWDTWDMIIAFPPCTYLTVTGNRWFNIEKYGQYAINRFKEREKAISFFMEIVNADCDKIAIENPIGVMSSYYRKPDQIIQPYMFGEPARKSTCLWLKNLPLLKATDIVEPEIIHYKNGKGTDNPWHMSTMSLSKDERSKERSKTFKGIAKAMAKQWGDIYNVEEVK